MKYVIEILYVQIEEDVTVFELRRVGIDGIDSNDYEHKCVNPVLGGGFKITETHNELCVARERIRSLTHSDEAANITLNTSRFFNHKA